MRTSGCPPRNYSAAPAAAPIPAGTELGSRHSVACLSTDSRWPMPAWRPCRAQLLSARGRVDHADEKCQGAAQSQRGRGSPGPGPPARISTPVEPSRGGGLQGRVKGLAARLRSTGRTRRRPGAHRAARRGGPVCNVAHRGSDGTYQCSRARTQCEDGRRRRLAAGTRTCQCQWPSNARLRDTTVARCGHDPYHDVVRHY